MYICTYFTWKQYTQEDGDSVVASQRTRATLIKQSEIDFRKQVRASALSSRVHPIIIPNREHTAPVARPLREHIRTSMCVYIFTRVYARGGNITGGSAANYSGLCMCAHTRARAQMWAYRVYMCARSRNIYTRYKERERGERNEGRRSEWETREANKGNARCPRYTTTTKRPPRVSLHRRPRMLRVSLYVCLSLLLLFSLSLSLSLALSATFDRACALYTSSLLLLPRERARG